jgi:hypothetical protein
VEGEGTVNLKLAGYEMKPKDQFQKELTAYMRRLSQGGTHEPPPTPAAPVYTDEQGNYYMALPSEEGVTAVPFVPGSPADGDRGGFMPVGATSKGEHGHG